MHEKYIERSHMDTFQLEAVLYKSDGCSDIRTHKAAFALAVDKVKLRLLHAYIR